MTFLQGFGGSELTFEAWLQTSDYCHHGVLAELMDGIFCDCRTLRSYKQGDGYQTAMAMLRAGTIMSYSLNSQATDRLQRSADFNHFLITHPMALAVCHDFAVSTCYLRLAILS